MGAKAEQARVCRQAAANPVEQYQHHDGQQKHRNRGDKLHQPIAHFADDFAQLRAEIGRHDQSVIHGHHTLDGFGQLGRQLFGFCIAHRAFELHHAAIDQGAHIGKQRVARQQGSHFGGDALVVRQRGLDGSFYLPGAGSSLRGCHLKGRDILGCG